MNTDPQVLPANIGLRVDLTKSDQHPSLLQYIIIYDRKKFYSAGPSIKSLNVTISWELQNSISSISFVKGSKIL